MKKVAFAVLPALVVLAGCLVGPPPRLSGTIVVPALPSIVVLEAEPYYQHSGNFYFYQDNSWTYSSTRSGPRVQLPRDRYPKEVQFKGKGNDKDRGENHGQGKHDRQ